MIDRKKLYDLLYAKADKLLKKYDPCRVNKDLFGGTYCQKFNDRDELCCGGYNGKCEYWSTTGCTIKCLACKVGLCNCNSRYYIGEDIFYSCCKKIHAAKRFNNKMYKLIRIANKYDLIMVRATKEQLFAEV